MIRNRTPRSGRRLHGERSSPRLAGRRYHRDDPDNSRVRNLAERRLISAELEDFMRYLHSPWYIIWRNIVVGLARGLGAVFGATVIVALAIWVLKIFIGLPLIGQYAKQVRVKVDEIAQEARYSDDFVRLQSTMEQIDLRLKTQNELLEQVLEKRQSAPGADEVVD